MSTTGNSSKNNNAVRLAAFCAGFFISGAISLCLLYPHHGRYVTFMFACLIVMQFANVLNIFVPSLAKSLWHHSAFVTFIRSTLFSIAYFISIGALGFALDSCLPATFLDSSTGATVLFTIAILTGFATASIPPLRVYLRKQADDNDTSAKG